MVGDYNSEDFDSGDGSLVRDNAVFALAHLYRALKLRPSGLVFHKECRRDNHDCPGRNVQKADVIQRVVDVMRTLDGGIEPPEPETGTVASPDGTLNLRASAGARSTIITILRDGQALDILDETMVSSAKWLYIRSEDGQTGWVAARYVEIT